MRLTAGRAPTADYSTSVVAVQVNLNGLTSSGGDAEGDCSPASKRVIGGLADGVIRAGSAADSLLGGAGNDTFIAGSGPMPSTAGPAPTQPTIRARRARFSIALDGSVGSGAEAAGDTLANVEQLTGSAFNDTLGGSTGDDLVAGGAGNDVIRAARAAIPSRVGRATIRWWRRRGPTALTAAQTLDTADYSASASAVTPHLDGTAGSQGDTANDVLRIGIGSATTG